MDSTWTHRGLDLHLTAELHRDLITASSDGRNLSRFRQSGRTAWIHRDGVIFIEPATPADDVEPS